MGAQSYTPGPGASQSQRYTLQQLLNEDSYSNSIKLDKETEVLSIISYCTNLTNDFESPSQQDVKRFKLTHLLCVIQSLKKPLNDTVLLPLMSMLSLYLFRPLRPPCSNFCATTVFLDDEDVVSIHSPTWPQLHIVYNILLRLVNNLDTNILGKYIDHSFLLNLLSRFQSEDPRERENLKNVYHRIYYRFAERRLFMRKTMKNVLLEYVSDTVRHCGIGEILEIWGSIINGFTVPLKEEHKGFLMRVLIPLHKPKEMQSYHRQLAYCVSQFVQKEPVVGGYVLRGILRYWPLTNCQKEVFLIGELEELVEYVEATQHKKLALPLCVQITRCLTSMNSQVAERALYIWNNEQFVKMATSAMEEVYPVVVQGIENNIKWHWCKSVKQLTQNIKAMLQEMEPLLYLTSVDKIQVKECEAYQEEKKRNQRWERIELLASSSQNQLSHPLPVPQCMYALKNIGQKEK